MKCFTSRETFMGLLSSHFCERHFTKAVDYSKVKQIMLLGACACGG